MIVMFKFYRSICIAIFLPSIICWTGCDASILSKNNEPAFEIPSPNLPGAPLIPDRSVLRPFCRTSLGQINAGEAIATAFAIAIDSEDEAIALSAMSLMDIGDHFSRRPLPNELNFIKESITLSDAFGSMDGVVSAFSYIEINEAGFQDDPHAVAGDILAIRLPKKSPFKTFEISETLPEIGDKVWMCAALFVGAPPSQRQHSAVVTSATKDGSLCYRFNNAKISFQGTLGAPIINDEGKVVAVHLGTLDKSDHLVASGNPATRFLPYLKKALQSK